MLMSNGRGIWNKRESPSIYGEMLSYAGSVRMLTDPVVTISVLDLRALSKVMLRVPFQAVFFCIPFSVTQHIFDL